MPSVLLFRPIYDPRCQWAPTFPWGLMCVSAILVERGVDVTMIDQAATPDCHEEVVRVLEAKRPIAVGVSAMTGDQVRYGLEFARLVRKHSDAAIVWGGVHPSLLPEQTVRNEFVDYVVAGEGEHAFADLIDHLAGKKDPRDIPGVYVQRNGNVHGSRQEGFIDLAALPDIPYDLVDVERYIHKRPDLGAERHFEICTSRGCPHHCGFCYVESVHSSRWRCLEADIVAGRIKALVERFHLDSVLFREDNFFVQRKRVERIARRLIDDNVGIKWAASCRIDYFDKYSPEFVDLLRRSGCVLLTFGVESGSDRMLDIIRKDITGDAVRRVARRVEESGIQGSYHFMAGFPGETPEELVETCRLIDTIRQVAPRAAIRDLAVFTPYPGVGLIPECVKRGYEEPDALEGWVAMDWGNPRRPWLSERQSRLIRDAQFLIARLEHPNPLVGTWVRARWKQFVNSPRGMVLRERPAMELLRRALRSQRQ